MQKIELFIEDMYTVKPVRDILYSTIINQNTNNLIKIGWEWYDGIKLLSLYCKDFTLYGDTVYTIENIRIKHGYDFDDAIVNLPIPLNVFIEICQALQQ